MSHESKQALKNLSIKFSTFGIILLLSSVLFNRAGLLAQSLLGTTWAVNISNFLFFGSQYLALALGIYSIMVGVSIVIGLYLYDAGEE